MKRFRIAFAILLALSAGAAGGSSIVPEPGETDPSTEFVSIDLRYARNATILGQEGLRLHANRQSSAGLLVALKTNKLVADFAYEHDYETLGGALARLFQFDSGEFSRDRYEYTIGYAPVSRLEVIGGARNERIDFAADAFEGKNPFGPVDLEYFAFLIGAKAATRPDLPLGAFISFRTYFGGTGVGSIRGLTDTKGHRFEGGFPIRIGNSPVRITPGFVFESLETGHIGLELTTRRFFINIGLGMSGNSGRAPLEGR